MVYQYEEILTRKNEAVSFADRNENFYRSQIDLMASQAIVYGYGGKSIDVQQNHWRDIKTSIGVICVKPSSTACALYDQSYRGKVLIVNDGSYTNPGGNYLTGEFGSEADLCRNTTLFNVQSRLNDEYYKFNKKDLNDSLFYNRALYTPNVLVRDLCYDDILTISSPDKNFCRQNANKQVLISRAKLIFDIAAMEKVDTLIIPAFGCDLHGQDASEVAQIFKDVLSQYTCFEQIYFCIPYSRDNYGVRHTEIFDVFKEVLSNCIID